MNIYSSALGLTLYASSWARLLLKSLVDIYCAVALKQGKISIKSFSSTEYYSTQNFTLFLTGHSTETYSKLLFLAIVSLFGVCTPSCMNIFKLLLRRMIFFQITRMVYKMYQKTLTLSRRASNMLRRE